MNSDEYVQNWDIHGYVRECLGDPSPWPLSKLTSCGASSDRFRMSLAPKRPSRRGLVFHQATSTN